MATLHETTNGTIVVLTGERNYIGDLNLDDDETKACMAQALGFKEKIIEVLCSLALSDHLGDVRDAESGLWDLINVPKPSYDDIDYDASPFQQTKARLKAAGLSLPDYLGDDDDDD